MRRHDIEDVLGSIEMPDMSGGEYLVALLFKLGPAKSERPLDEQDLEAWEKRRGLELAPWQAELIVDMSRAYLSEMYAARKKDAPPPWPVAANAWRYVQDQRIAKSHEVAEEVAEVAEQMRKAHGNRKRR